MITDEEILAEEIGAVENILAAEFKCYPWQVRLIDPDISLAVRVKLAIDNAGAEGFGV